VWGGREEGTFLPEWHTQVPSSATKGVDVSGPFLAAKAAINLHLALPGIIALLAGVLILIFPKLLNYVVAAYLIVVGLIQVFNLHV